MHKFAMTLAGSLLLTGCVSYGGGKDDLAKPADEAIEAAFQCTDGARIDVAFTSDKARLTISGVSHMLVQERTGSGYAYAGAGHSLRGKGGDVTWIEPSGASHACAEIAAAP